MSCHPLRDRSQPIRSRGARRRSRLAWLARTYKVTRRLRRQPINRRVALDASNVIYCEPSWPGARGGFRSITPSSAGERNGPVLTSPAGALLLGRRQTIGGLSRLALLLPIGSNRLAIHCRRIGGKLARFPNILAVRFGRLGAGAIRLVQG